MRRKLWGKMGLDIFMFISALLGDSRLYNCDPTAAQHSDSWSSAAGPEASGLRCSARLEAFGVEILDGKEVRAVGWTTLRKTKERGQARLPDRELIKVESLALLRRLSNEIKRASRRISQVGKVGSPPLFARAFL
jgi:hypothetical protein